MLTTVQDWPGRIGYWEVGVPPSGPMDDRSFRIGNRVLGNHAGAAGLEVTLNGPGLRFLLRPRSPSPGAAGSDARREPCRSGRRSRCRPAACWRSGRSAASACAHTYSCAAASTASGPRQPRGVRRRRCSAGAAAPRRPARARGATAPCPAARPMPSARQRARTRARQRHDAARRARPARRPGLPHPDGLQSARGELGGHHHSDRTGVRLVGPRPAWSRADGGEAGLHPSNILDSAYSVGTIMLAGDMAVIVGPDGPSLGGFAAIAQVIRADMWRLGQLRAGDHVTLAPVEPARAAALPGAAERRR